MLGMVSGLISDSQITASNQGERSWMPENIRLVTSRSGWVLPPGPQSYINEWLQVDLGEEKIVRGIIIQGGKHRENKGRERGKGEKERGQKGETQLTLLEGVRGPQQLLSCSELAGTSLFSPGLEFPHL